MTRKNRFLPVVEMTLGNRFLPATHRFAARLGRNDPVHGLTWEEGNRAQSARFPSSHNHNTNGVTSKELATERSGS